MYKRQEQSPGLVAAHLVGDERREALAPGEPFRTRKRDMGIVVGERGHAVRGDARVVRGEAARHRRVAVERQPVERVAVQVEHPQAIRRHGLFAREPHGVLLRQPLKRCLLYTSRCV